MFTYRDKLGVNCRKTHMPKDKQHKKITKRNLYDLLADGSMLVVSI